MNAYDRGESIPVTVTLTDGTNDIDNTTFTTIVVKVMHKYLGTLLERYSLAGSTVTRGTPSTDGEITFIVPATTTVDAALGVYEYQVKTTETDTDYESNVRTRVFRGDAFYLKRART